MSSKPIKLITVPQNGQISIGKGWAGRQIRVEEVSPHEIHIWAGTFVPDSQKLFFTPDAKKSLEKFNQYEQSTSAKASNTKSLFSELRKKKKTSGR